MQESIDTKANPKRLTASQIAELESVSRRTVLDWYHSKIIDAEYHVGKVIRFDLKAVRASLSKYRSSNTNPAA